MRKRSTPSKNRPVKIAIACASIVGVFCLACSLVLTMIADDVTAERFGPIAEGLMQAFNTCLIGVFGMIGLQLRFGDEDEKAEDAVERVTTQRAPPARKIKASPRRVRAQSQRDHAD